MTFGVRASVDTHLNYLFGVQIGQCHIQCQHAHASPNTSRKEHTQRFESFDGTA